MILKFVEIEPFKQTILQIYKLVVIPIQGQGGERAAHVHLKDFVKYFFNAIRQLFYIFVDPLPRIYKINFKDSPTYIKASTHRDLKYKISMLQLRCLYEEGVRWLVRFK